MVFLFQPSAPHQPRLDWQMWFAALGRYEHNPWLIHLIYRLLVGQKEGTVLTWIVMTRFIHVRQMASLEVGTYVSKD